MRAVASSTGIHFPSPNGAGQQSPGQIREANAALGVRGGVWFYNREALKGRDN